MLNVKAMSSAQRGGVAVPAGLDPDQHRIIAAHFLGIEHWNGTWRRVGDMADRVLVRLEPEHHEKAA